MMAFVDLMLDISPGGTMADLACLLEQRFQLGVEHFVLDLVDSVSKPRATPTRVPAGEMRRHQDTRFVDPDWLIEMETDAAIDHDLA